jgi:hypothetical protein
LLAHVVAVVHDLAEICEFERQRKEVFCKGTVYNPKSGRTHKKYNVVNLREINGTCCSINSITKNALTPVDTFDPQKIELPVCVMYFVRRITTPDDATLQEMLKQVLVLEK